MFTVIGICSVIIDFLTYSSLLTYIALNKESAKGIGFVAGTLFAYFGNRSLTFSKKIYRKKSFMYFFTLYLLTLLINILINSFILKIIDATYMGYKIAFLVATAVSASLNFIGMKFFVFKSIRE
jgi:putative flippase GtrA